MDTLTIILLVLIILLSLGHIVNLIQTLRKISVELCISPVDLKKKYGDWAIVTGSTDGIGKEYAKQLANKNINLVLISRTLEKLNSTKDEIQKIYPTVQIKVIQADLSKMQDEINKIKAELINIPVGILVNNVGILSDYPMYFEEFKENDLWNQINVNIGAMVLMSHLVIKQMKKRGKGAIINISSASNLAPVPLLSIYSSTKIFGKYFTDSLRAEYTKYGLTIQSLSPFFIRTKMVKFSDKLYKSNFHPDAEQYVRSAIRVLGRFDSSAGYWTHDMLTFLSSLFPVWLHIKIGYYITSYYRKDYFKQQ